MGELERRILLGREGLDRVRPTIPWPPYKLAMHTNDSLRGVAEPLFITLADPYDSIWFDPGQEYDVSGQTLIAGLVD